jgi:hypothetical protein
MLSSDRRCVVSDLSLMHQIRDCARRHGEAPVDTTSDWIRGIAQADWNKYYVPGK